MARVVILGAGVMGSAMAVPLAHNGHAVDLVGTHLDGAIVGALAEGRPHPSLRVPLGSTVSAHRWTEFPYVMSGQVDLLILGVASAGVDWAIEQMAKGLHRPIPLVVLTKGLIGTGATIEIIPALIAREIERLAGFAVPVMAIGGPCIAGELAAARDTSVVLAGEDHRLLEQTRALLETLFYHVELSPDTIGVEVCAAFKNFFALGVGAAATLVDRLPAVPNKAAAHNIVAATFTRAVAEMALITEAVGGSQATAYGLAGVGDLHVTCQAGRNSRMGQLLGQGLLYSHAKLEKMPTDTVEGAQLALALGPTLDAMMSHAELPAERLRLARAIIDAICRDAILDVLAIDPR